MTPIDFLTAVWPATGTYVLALPFTPPGSAKSVYTHRTFTSIAAAAAWVDRNKATNNIFFGVHSLKQASVFNPTKIDARTGATGAFEVRTQANSMAARCFYMDLDVGPSSGKILKFASQAEALQDLAAFCQATGLPLPTIVSSGSGIHVYWLLTDDLTSDVWRTHARKLKALSRHYNLKADPSRTEDSASVLRVAGTSNFKTAPALPVSVLAHKPATDTQHFISLLDAALIRSGVFLTEMPAPAAAPANSSQFGNNTTREYQGPPVTLRALVTACATVAEVVRHRGNVSEPEWYHTLNLVRWVEDGARLVHKVSEGHPDYSYAATEAKVAQLARNPDVKPTSCTKLAEVCGSEKCVVCPFYGKVTNPLHAARYRDPAPAPVVILTPGNADELAIPDPPHPFMRLKGGGIAFSAKNKEGETVETTIYDNDLFPLRRVSVTTSNEPQERQVWRAVFQKGNHVDFTMDADAVYDRRKFTVAIANAGIYPDASNLQYVQDYMIAYIKELQRLIDADKQYEHLGWMDQNVGFILPGKILMCDGSIKPVSLSKRGSSSLHYVVKRGDVQKQAELLRFYSHLDYIPNQFYILAALGAPLFYATGQHGVVINASGEPGASKSSTLSAAASLWGRPDLYIVNGTKRGATQNFRDGRLQTLANLPVCVDEITKMVPEDASAMVMNVTQPSTRGRSNQDGSEQIVADTSKSTIMLCTSNDSLSYALAQDNNSATAGSMRLIEILFHEQHRHTKPEADQFLWELAQNYGHIGEAFMTFVVRNREAVERRVQKVLAELDQDMQTRPRERFWSAAMAVALVAGDIANRMGLLAFDINAIRTWLIQVQTPQMRSAVATDYASPLEVLTTYMESISGSIIVTDAVQTSVSRLTMQFPAPVLRKPTGNSLLGHHDVSIGTMWLLKQGFKDHCRKIGANAPRLLEELNKLKATSAGTAARVVASINVRKVLGAGTEWAKGQSWCFAVNMDHPEVAGRTTNTLQHNNDNPKVTHGAGNVQVASGSSV